MKANKTTIPDARFMDGYPTDPKLRGVAAAIYHSDIPPWEFDIAAVPPGTDPPRMSDWCRRGGDARMRESSRRTAEALALPKPLARDCGR